MRAQMPQHRLQVGPVDVLHHDEMRARCLADVEYLHALRMAQVTKAFDAGNLAAVDFGHAPAAIRSTIL